MDHNAGTWNVDDVVSWARCAQIPEEAVRALSVNGVDGATLITMTKEELQSELGIRSFPARRYLWDLVERLRTEQHVKDHALAIEAHLVEIENLTIKTQAPDEPGGIRSDDPAVVQTLLSDAARERQIIEDYFLVCSMQCLPNGGWQCYEDHELACQEKVRLDQLHLQSECDRRIAVSMAPVGQRPAEAPDNNVRSLFGLCVDVCSQNRINVAEALATRAKDPLIDGFEILTIDEQSGWDESKIDNEDSFFDIDKLPLINRCNVCFEESRRGFLLPCTHPYCVECMRSYLERAFRDLTLLPLRCCEIEIDIRVAPLLMRKEDAMLLLTRSAELQVTNKMYCPTCNQFINLDLVDTSEGTEVECDCGTKLCVSCRTVEHPLVCCDVNKAATAGSDEPLHELARENGWKQCPQCSIMIELTVGCYHVTCSNCKHGFCFVCLEEWDRNRGTCNTGQCAVWDERRLVAGAEARVQAQEQANRALLNPIVRQRRIEREMAALRENEHCNHNWIRRSLRGECERCGFELYVYGMVCAGGCRSTVCYTCAHHRIPQRGWE